jgi:predicted DNA-binding transcriptional regulator AlpA
MLLNKHDVCRLLGGIHSSTLWRLIKAERFPKPIKVSTQIRRWRLSDVEAALEAMRGRS